MTVSPIPSLGPTREQIARLIDPDAWSFADRHAGKPVLQPEVTFETRRSLTKADAILALFPVEAGDVGWRMVPVEPTREMSAAGFKHWNETRVTTPDLIYRAMLAASPPLAEGEGK